MQLGMIGLGKMGANMTTRLIRGGYEFVAYDLNETAVQAIEKQGVRTRRLHVAKGLQ
jgi:6-phosphogluconate dehydrogenase